MGSLDQLYQQVILDHAREKHGEGDPAGMDATSHQVNPTCGDEVTLGVTLDGQTLASVQWDGDGCSISRASLSMMTDLGVDDEILDELGDAAALESTSQFANRVKCALLGWYALRDAMAKSGIDISNAGEPAEQ